MNNIDIRSAERTPVVYIAGIDGDADGATKAWLKNCIAEFAPLAVSAPGAIMADNTDYGRLSAEALNEFLVDADADAVLWASGPDVGGERYFHCAVAHYPKVKYVGRDAGVFTLRTANTGEATTGRLLAANILGATLSEIAAIRPAPSALIDACMHEMEAALAKPLERELYLGTLERLQNLFAATGRNDQEAQPLRRAIELNECLCGEVDGADTAHHARLLQHRASCLAILGARTGEVKDILGAITALKRAAPHIRDDAGCARLDVTLANCKSALGALLDDAEILLSARDLLRGIIPVLYHQLAVESWAAAHASLSATCWHLYGVTGEFEHAAEALDAAHEALTVYNAKTFPFAWAKAKGHLGLMLSTLGDDPENIDALYCGIDCLRDALGFYTPDRFPKDHAVTAANLSAALCALAAHTNDADHLDSAEHCLLGALNIYKHGNDPKAVEIERRLATVRRKTLLPQ